MLRYPWTYVYVLLIPLVNWSFAHVPTFELPAGGLWSPMAVVTGLVLVFRDFAQREVGHYIFIPLIIGIAISYSMAPAAIATASACAFAISELVDWAIYSFTKKPLSQRVLISSAASAPLDTAIFWYGANMVTPGVFHWGTLITAIASKMLGAVIVYFILRHREHKSAEYDRKEFRTILTEPVLSPQPFTNQNPTLPEELFAKAHINTNYPVWRIEDVPTIIEWARSQSIGILGGELQLHFPGGIYDCYWLDFDAAQHGFDEPWNDYVERSTRESLASFQKLCARMNFIESLRTTFPDLLDAAEELNIDLNDHIYFTVDFWTEQDDQSFDTEYFDTLTEKYT